MSDKQPEVTIRNLYGFCPVQAEGTIDGEEFYFRARGEKWSIVVGGDLMDNPEFRYEEPYGVWPEAGWMELEKARELIHAAARKFVESRASRPAI